MNGSGVAAARDAGMGRLLIYGANGFVGRAAVEEARARGWHPIVAGRDDQAIGRVAREAGLEPKVFALDDPGQVREGLAGVTVVLNMAGPFAFTSRPLVEACLEVGAHYVDITGEMDVLIDMAVLGAAARERGVMLLPGAGLDSVPADCLAAYLCARLPSATTVRLGLRYSGPAGLPPGTLKTMTRLAHLPDKVVRGGRPVEVGGTASGTIDFGDGPVTAVRYQAADTLVVNRTTGVGDVEAYVALPPVALAGYLGLRTLRRMLSPRPVRDVLARFVRGGSTADQRRRSSTVVWAEARDDAGGRVAARLHGPEGAVVWTVSTALNAAERGLTGRAVPGLQTAGAAFGPDFVLLTPGVARVDA